MFLNIIYNIEMSVKNRYLAHLKLFNIKETFRHNLKLREIAY